MGERVGWWGEFEVCKKVRMGAMREVARTAGKKSVDLQRLHMARHPCRGVRGERYSFSLAFEC